MSGEIIMNSKKYMNLTTWFIVDFAICFMLCVFAPIDAFYANKDEFWFNLGQMVLVSIITFFALFIILCGISIVINKCKFSDYVFAYFIGLFVYLYIQGNYIPRNYGVLNGTDIDWVSYKGYAVASIVLGAICIGFCTVLILKFRQHIFKVGRAVAIFIVLIQGVTLGTLMIQNGFSDTTNLMITTDKDYFDLSQDRNIIVFLLDTYDGDDLEYLIEEDYKNQSEIFEDFTFYRNTLGAYPTTKCAMPYILTGVWYQNEEPYVDYVKNAYIDNEIYNAFKANDFKLDIYTDSLYLGKRTLYENIELGSYSIKNRFAFAQKLYSLVAFNYMPHQLKKHFFIDTDTFSDLKKSNTENKVYSSNVITNVKSFEDKGITVSKTGNVLKFYHLAGVHGPYTFGEDLKEDGKTYSSYDEAAGNNEFLRKYFLALKEKGIYDSSTIIVMADHGHNNYSQNPIFLIKNAGENHNFFISEAEMSYEYLPNIWIALANGTLIDEKFIQSCHSENRLRRFLNYGWDDAWSREYMPGMEEMFCNGVAYEPENLITSGQTYFAENEDHTYNLGTTLEFKDGRNAYSYCLYGISYGNVCQEALMKFDIRDEFENLLINIKLAEDCGIGIVAIYANDKIVAEFLYDGSDPEIEFVIPHEYVQDGSLGLKFDQFAENSKNAAFTGTSLNIYEIKLIDTSKEFDVNRQKIAYKYELGKEIGFTIKDSMSVAYIRSGFSGMEEWGTWTIGNKASLRFKINDVNDDLELMLNYGTFDGEQHVELYVNDQLISKYLAIGKETRKIHIPASYLNGEYVDISFKLPDAHSPSSIDKKNTDKRELALGFQSLCLSKEQKYKYGSDITFSGDNSSLNYIKEGFSTPENGFTWTNGKAAELTIPIVPTTEDVELIMNYGTFNGKQTVIVEINGDVVSDYVDEGKMSKTVIIPATYTENGILDIRLELPDAISPKEIDENNKDDRLLALQFYNMKLILRETALYHIGTTLKFTTADKSGLNYVVAGFSAAEPEGTWTDGKEAELAFKLDDYKGGDLSLNIEYSTYHDKQHVTLYANGKQIADYDANGNESKSFDIPKSVTSNDIVKLKLVLKDATSPKSNGESDDIRELALSVKNLKITEK